MPSNGMNSNGSCMNVDNHMGDRASSRVLAPPGGKSSISFGGYEEAPPPQRRAAPQQTTAGKENQQQQAGVFNAQPEYVQKRGTSAMTSNTGTQNQGNTLGDRPTTRVVNPPGGRSSIVF
eukprot:Hpha_TRINITY_DN15856_c0_g3::TRINITY_DN15856_c0_g3_i4::g.189958::m.189958